MKFLKITKLQNALIFLFIIFTLGISPLIASASTSGLSLQADKTNLFIGEKSTVKVMVDYSDSVNALSGTITIPTEHISDVSVSLDKSIVSFWTEEPMLAGNKIVFEGIVVGASNNSAGELFRINFVPMDTVSSLSFSFSEGSVFTNEGNGENTIGEMTPVSLSVSTTKPKLIPKVKIKTEDVAVAPQSISTKKVEEVNDDNQYASPLPNGLTASVVQEDSINEKSSNLKEQRFTEDKPTNQAFSSVSQWTMIVLPFFCIAVVIYIPWYYHRKMQSVLKKFQSEPKNQ